MSVSAPDRHIAAAKRRLVHLSGIGERTVAAERSILIAAEQRQRVVEKDLAGLADRVLTDHDAAERYVTLVQERGRLRLVIASSREALHL